MISLSLERERKEQGERREHCRDASRFVQYNLPDKEMMLVIQGTSGAVTAHTNCEPKRLWQLLSMNESYKQKGGNRQDMQFQITASLFHFMAFFHARIKSAVAIDNSQLAINWHIVSSLNRIDYSAQLRHACNQ